MRAWHGTDGGREASIRSRGLVGASWVTVDRAEAGRYGSAAAAASYHRGGPPVSALVELEVPDGAGVPDHTGAEPAALLLPDGAPPDWIVGVTSTDHNWRPTAPSLTLAIATVRAAALLAARRRGIAGWVPTDDRRVDDPALIGAGLDVLAGRST